MQSRIFAIIMSTLFLLSIYWIGYELPRENFEGLMLTYLSGFAFFYMLYLNRQQWKFHHFLIIAVAARLILLFAVPELSNDFYRFIWDGELMTRGVNPYAHTPNDLISQAPFYNDQYMRILFHGMGELSQANYSCYPVVNQLFFLIPTAIFESIQANVIAFKVIIILADIGIILIGKRLLVKLGKSPQLIWLFALNPFIILEFTGNLHFEGVMIFFLLLGLHYILKENWLLAGLFFAIAIQVKLIPLILIPFVFKKLQLRQSIGFTAMTALIVLLIGSLLLNEQLFQNFWVTIQLYTQSFEFNASLFYMMREISFARVGYDEIATFGPLFSYIAMVGIILLAIFKRYKNPASIFTGMLFALTIYYAFATVVHPWYISMLLILSIFTNYKFTLVWSLLVMLSYAAYSNPQFEENLWLVGFEYLMVFAIMFYEIWKNTDKSDFGIQLNRFLGKDE